MADSPRRLPDFVNWPSFPFTGDIRVKPLLPVASKEPPRQGETEGTCHACAAPDEAYIWVSDRWRVRAMERPTGLPMVLILESRSHLDLGDLPNLLAAELGVMTVRLERAVRSLDGVARVHVNRWGDGSAHLHLWFLARPFGYLQLRGSFLSLWDDILPPIDEDVWRENLAMIAAWLAEFGGRPLAEPPRIDWKAPASLAIQAAESAQAAAVAAEQAAAAADAVSLDPPAPSGDQPAADGQVAKSAGVAGGAPGVASGTPATGTPANGGPANNGPANNGPVSAGPVSAGPASGQSQGAAPEGGASNNGAPASQGAAQNGIAQNGTAHDGAPSASTAHDGASAPGAGPSQAPQGAGATSNGSRTAASAGPAPVESLPASSYAAQGAGQALASNGPQGGRQPVQTAVRAEVEDDGEGEWEPAPDDLPSVAVMERPEDEA